LFLYCNYGNALQLVAQDTPYLLSLPLNKEALFLYLHFIKTFTIKKKNCL
jgi:hypothetical protein